MAVPQYEPPVQVPGHLQFRLTGQYVQGLDNPIPTDFNNMMMLAPVEQMNGFRAGTLTILIG